MYRDASGRIVAVLEVSLPQRDNRHMADIELSVDPVCWRRGIGSELFEIGERTALEAGRTVMYSGRWAGTPGQRFLEQRGYTQASVYVNRGQDLLAIDRDKLARDVAAAAAGAEGYELLRMPDKTPDEYLEQVARMTTAINDAPRDDLKMEDEVFTVDRIQAFEAAQAAYGRRVYRLIAREKATGEFAGHTMVCVQADRPWLGDQFDTSVLAAHRGHRLGLLLKAGMLQWLFEEEPQLREVQTWNAKSNSHMIGVNEELGYRVLGEAVGYQRDFAPTEAPTDAPTEPQPTGTRPSSGAAARHRAGSVSTSVESTAWSIAPGRRGTPRRCPSRSTRARTGGSVIAAVRLAVKPSASTTRMSRVWNRRGPASTGSARPSSLVAAPSRRPASVRAASRPRQSVAASAASSGGPTCAASGRSAKARVSHLLYGAHRRSIRNVSRMWSRTRRAATTREPRSSPRPPVRPTKACSCPTRSQPAAST